MAEPARYEVHTLRQGRWILHEVCESEAAAKRTADRLVGALDCDAARVVRDKERETGDHAEKVVYTVSRHPRRPVGKIAPGQIERAPLCERLDDYFAYAGRAAIGRVLRPWLDNLVVTPSELLHCHRLLERLANAGDLLLAAVDRVASVQARDFGLDGRKRRDDIFAAFEAVKRKAAAAARLRLPDVDPRSFTLLRRKIETQVGNRTRDYHAMVALADYLSQFRSWLSKLAAVLDLLQGDLDLPARAQLDGALADILGVAEVVEELLGWQPNLAAAVCRLADLADGQMRVDAAAGGPLAILNEMLAVGLLPEARQALLDRICRLLSGAVPLNRAEPSDEEDAFGRVVARLTRPYGMLGGGATAEALTLRACRLNNRGGALGRKDGMAAVLACLPGGLAKATFLVELADSPLGRSHAGDIAGLLALITEARDLDELVQAEGEPVGKVEAVTELHRRIADSALPASDREEFCRRLDDLQARYLVEWGVIESLDDPDDPLHDRATRLVRFCASGALIPGRCLAMARARVVEHLRQPNFEAAFVAGIATPAGREAALRDFHALLRRAGFEQAATP